MATILIADDSSIMRRNLKKILTEAGYTVVAEAGNGLEACQAYDRHLPDLVTMDITMPVMDGIEAVRTIMKAHPSANILVISAFDQRKMLFEAVENGARQYLIKPLTPDKLLMAVKQLFDSIASSDSNSPTPSQNASRSEDLDYTHMPAPLQIENRNGVFVFKLKTLYTAQQIEELHTALTGLLFIKPLKIEFQFEQPPQMNSEILLNFESVIKRIIQAGGQLSILAADISLFKPLHDRFAEIELFQSIE